MTARPRILLTTRHDVRRGKAIQFVGELHLRLLLEHGAMPVQVVIADGIQAHLTALLADADGLLITEGGDVGPGLREADPSALEELDPLKDEVEVFLMREALERELPILGVCRGAELLNVLLGGDLYDDIPTELGRSTPHIDEESYHSHRHPLELVEGSLLHEIYGTKRISATSYHHQGVRHLAEALEPMAVAPDGLVEAFRHVGHPFAWGLQFHPERQQEDHPAHREIHARLVAAAREFGHRR